MDSKWATRFLGLAKEVASWSKDPTSKVGAVIVRSDRTISSVGFNGFPRGVNDDQSLIANRDTKLLRTIHAELNAILSAKEPLVGHSLFVWPFQPCSQCAAAIIQSGIAKIYCPANAHIEGSERWKESFKNAKEMLDEAGVKIIFS